LVFAAVVFICLSLYANFHELTRALRQFPLYFLPIMLFLSLCNYLIRFFKWDYYLGILEIDIPKAQSVSIFLAGLIMSISPGKFGEVLKSFLLKSVNETPISRSAPIVVAERLTDFMGLIVLVLVSLTGSRGSVEVLIISIILVIVLITLCSSRSLSFRIISLLERLIKVVFASPRSGEGHGNAAVSKGFRLRLQSGLVLIPQKLHIAYESIHVLVSVKRLVWTTILSVISWSFEGIAFILLLRGFDVRLAYNEALFIYVFSIIVGALTMLPGGVGLTETSLSGLLILKEIPKSIAVAATLIIRVTTLWFAVGIGVIMLIVFMRKTRIDQLQAGQGPELAGLGVISPKK